MRAELRLNQTSRRRQNLIRRDGRAQNQIDVARVDACPLDRFLRGSHCELRSVFIGRSFPPLLDAGARGDPFI